MLCVSPVGRAYVLMSTGLKSSLIRWVEPTALVSDVVLMSTGLKSSFIIWVEPLALVRKHCV